MKVGLQRAAWGALPWVCGGGYGLGLSRYGFELQPALFEVFGAWPGALTTAAVFGAALALWAELARRSSPNSFSPFASLALFLPIVSVLSPQVNLLRAQTLLLGALVLFILLIATPANAEREQVPRLPLSLFLFLSLFLLYLYTLAPAVGEADTFEFQVGIAWLGIAHGSGYPLLMLVGKLFTLLPVGGTLAFRANLTSAFFGAAAGVGVERLARRLGASPLCALFSGFAFGVSPTLWARAVEVEAYTLNAALVVAILHLAIALVGQAGSGLPVRYSVYLLAFVFGLSLTNHLTTLVLAPACLAAVLIAHSGPHDVSRLTHHVSRLLLPASFFLFLGLSAYLYIPLRWPAVNRGERLTAAQFVNIATGSEARGAFQPSLPFKEMDRYGIVLRKIVGEYSWAGAALTLVGAAALVLRRGSPRQSGNLYALVLALAYAGYGYFALAFNVPDPDFSAFLIPLFLIAAVLMGVGLQAMLDTQFANGLSRIVYRVSRPMQPKSDTHTPTHLADPAPSGAHTHTLILCLILPLAFLLPLRSLWLTLPRVDQSSDWSKQHLGEFTLRQPLAQGATILADSDKVGPLYYLQVAEGVRPDLDIVVLPDEDSYRTALDERLASGRTVYLGRYLPGLGSLYFLRSVGPLAEVSASPFASDEATMASSLRLSATLASSIQLVGYRAEALTASPSGPDSLRLSLYWHAAAPTKENYLVSLRLIPVGKSGTVAWQSAGSVPVSRMYPTNAWRPGEVVSDFHIVPVGESLAPGRYRLEAGLFLPFQASATADWAEVTEIQILPPSVSPRPPHLVRAQLGKQRLVGYAAPESAAPGLRLTVRLYWLRTSDVENATAFGETRTLAEWPVGYIVPQDYQVTAPGAGDQFSPDVGAGQPARCGWLAPITETCLLPPIQLVGEAAGEGAVNFDNQVLLRDVAIDTPAVSPGEQVKVTLEWQALQTIPENYTVFIHLLGPDGLVHGQVDAWPVSGTLATSQWIPGKAIQDHYTVPVPGEAPHGAYRVEIGLYLLATLQRLPVLDAVGAPVDDRVLVAGLTVR